MIQDDRRKINYPIVNQGSHNWHNSNQNYNNRLNNNNNCMKMNCIESQANQIPIRPMIEDIRADRISETNFVNRTLNKDPHDVQENPMGQ